MSTNFDTPPRTAPEFEGQQSAISCSVKEMRRVVETSTDLGGYPCADDPTNNVLVYGKRIRRDIVDPGMRREIQAELPRSLHTGRGNLVFQRAALQRLLDTLSHMGFHCARTNRPQWRRCARAPVLHRRPAARLVRPAGGDRLTHLAAACGFRAVLRLHVSMLAVL
jgi:hypothetical protein